MLALAALGAATPIVAVAQSRDANAKEWKLSTAVGTAFALGKAGERWAALVTENSGGKLAVVLRPGATLAERDPAREFTALRSGAADLAIGSTLYWSVQVRELGVVGLPWIAPEEKQLDALVTGVIAEKLAAAVQAGGAMPLAFAPLGHRELAALASVRTPDDFAGRAVRIASTPYLVDFYAGLAARPKAMSFTDARAAFESGQLDVQEGAPATFAAARLDAIGIRHVTLWGAVAEAAIFAVNPGVWEGWTDEERGDNRSAPLHSRQRSSLPRLHAPRTPPRWPCSTNAACRSCGSRHPVKPRLRRRRAPSTTNGPQWPAMNSSRGGSGGGRGPVMRSVNQTS